MILIVLNIRQRKKEGIPIKLEKVKYIDNLLQTLRLHFSEAYEHSNRVALCESNMAYQCGMSKIEISKVYLCGLLHDIGKIKVDSAILSKPEKLTIEEYETVKLHSQEGYLLIKDYVSEDIANGVLMHHERLDGTGYPSQLKGNDISFFAKLIMVADAYDAMTVNRVYRSEVLWMDALVELKKDVEKYDIECLEALERVVTLRNSEGIMY